MFRRPHGSSLFGNKFLGGPVTRKPDKARSVPDLGLQQHYERGSDAYDPRHMRSTRAHQQIASVKAIQQQKSNAVRAREMESLDSFSRASDLANFASPQNAQEAAFADSLFERELQLKADPSQIDERREKQQIRMPSGLNVPTGPEALVRPRRTHSPSTQNSTSNDLPYTTLMHRARVDEDTRRLYLKHKYAQTPTARQYSSALKKLSSEPRMDEEVELLQDRLVEESGLYPSQRLDAYMLRDESVFPLWVNELRPHLRDRVRYSGIGITEDDEVLRQNLAKMPADERAQEWARLKAAREYKQGTAERRVTNAEVRQLRLGIRRHHQLQQRRLGRATLLKRLTLRSPEKFEVWPTRDVDYSARLSQVAQFVEAGVPTMGEWPLDLRSLANARKKKVIAREAEKEFVNAGVALPYLGNGGAGGGKGGAPSVTDRIGQGVRDVLNRLEERERDVKRISRRYYHRRFTAIKLGDQDEHGRKYHQMERWAKTRRKTAYGSEDEMRAEREGLDRPNLEGRRYVANSGYGRAEYPYSEERRSVPIPHAGQPVQ